MSGRDDPAFVDDGTATKLTVVHRSVILVRANQRDLPRRIRNGDLVATDDALGSSRRRRRDRHDSGHEGDGHNRRGGKESGLDGSYSHSPSLGESGVNTT